MNIIKTILVATFGLVLTECASTKSQEMEPPFTVENGYFQKWLGGAPGSGTGINVFLPIMSIPPEVQIETAFFRNKSASIVLDSNYMYVARFIENEGQRPDVIMSDDPQEEAANTPPAQTGEVYPFPLSENEVGIKYTQNGKTKYTKVSNLVEKATIAYPSAPPRNGGYE